jgi:hypothetical protein
MKNEENNKKCGICKISPFERNNYFYGKLMTVKDYAAEQSYFNEKRWLINRMVNGSGVVCGLDVVRDGDKVCIKPGMAIDNCGREIVVFDTETVELNFEKDECADCVENIYVICIKYHKCEAEPLEILPIKCEGDGKPQYNRIRDSFKISVKCYQEAECDEISSMCPLENKTESLHNYICDAIRHKECTECEECNCVILAKVTVSNGDISIDNCSDRPLVYSNPMLYEMLECFHGGLPHVEDINWKDKEVNGAFLKWDRWDYISKLKTEDGGLKITFDKKMDETTINENTFLLMVKMLDHDTGNSKYEQIPGEVTYDYNDSTENPKSIATFEIASPWINDVYMGYSSLKDEGGQFKVILKSDFILSAVGEGETAKALDGNFIGGKLPSGNGTQGGDFISWFSVEAPPKPDTTKTKKQIRRR